MGQFLSFPATAKQTESGSDKRYIYAASAMQGWRLMMQDAHTAILALEDDAEMPDALFAVYDGHGRNGHIISEFAAKNLHQKFIKEQSYHEKQYEEALRGTFLSTDDACRREQFTDAGCTAIAVFLTGNENKIYVANAGDSRCVISIKGKVKALSLDHKPDNQAEKDRILAAEGYVEKGRVNGNLALTRGLGDFEYKGNKNLPSQKQIITADPEVVVHSVTEEEEFLVIACDGVWDCLESQQVVDFVRLKISEGKELHEITEMICDHCLAPDSVDEYSTGSDNMTVMVIALLGSRTKEQWYSWMTDRVRGKYGYDTPTILPRLYSEVRLENFRKSKEHRKDMVQIANRPRAAFSTNMSSA